MSTPTRIMLSSAVKRSLPRRSLVLPQRRGLAAHVNDQTMPSTGGTHQGHEHLQGASSKAHHPVSTAFMWGDEFWRDVPVYSNVSREEFLSYRWSTKNTVDSHERLNQFLNAVVPDEIPEGAGSQSKEQFMDDVYLGIKKSMMSLRITPHLLSRINWQDPRNDPIFRQFIPLGSILLPDHPKVDVDSLGEGDDEVVTGLVHRYPDKALFLAVSVCPTYCTYCTRCRAVGADTERLTKNPFKPGLKKWNEIFTYIEANPQIQDIVVSGGDSFYIHPEHIRGIGDRLMNIPHIRRFRFASKGLAVAPMRFLDTSDDWTDALIEVTQKAKKIGKEVAMHTHFNHANEFSWITEAAGQKLFAAGVTVRNQTVLLKGVNDDVQTMSTLIRKLADNHVKPYYVYMCDMVPNVEHYRTPLQTILDLESQIRGSIAGFNMPQFIVDLPGGGGKRDAWSKDSYDRRTGVSTFTAPAVTAAAAAHGGREKPQVFKYYDPINSDALAEMDDEIPSASKTDSRSSAS